MAANKTLTMIGLSFDIDLVCCRNFSTVVLTTPNPFGSVVLDWMAID